MDDTKNVSILEEKKRVWDTYQCTNKERDVVSKTFNKFRDAQFSRNQNFEYFDGLNLIDYIEDSVRRFVTNVDEREDIEDWQARVHDPFTRNKVLAILGKVIQVLPMAEITARGNEDIRKGLILNNLYEYSEDLDDYEELMIHLLLEAIVKGTAIGYEGHEKKVRLVKNVKNVNDKITIVERKEETNRLIGAILPLENFYPSSVTTRSIKKMPYCFWRNYIPFQTFLMDWSNFEQAQYVQPKRLFTGTEPIPFYSEFTSTDVPEGHVEIIRYYNRDVDEYIILANGIWLNPLPGEQISPLPFNHKELPFWEIKFDLFSSDFFYGKSLPDRLKSLQDVLNVLNNMLLDQSFLTIFPPLLTSGFDSIEDDYLRPGRRTPVDTQGGRLSDSYLKMDIGVPTGWHQYILEYTRKIMEQSSVDQVSQGVAGVGGRTTAAEIRTAAEGVQSLLGLFARLINYGLKRKALFRSKNILQFWTDPKSPIIKQVLGEDGSDKFNKAFNVINISNGILTTGKRGAKIIELYASTENMPTKEDLKARASLKKLESNKNIEIVAVPAEYLRNLDFDIKLVPSVKNDKNKDMEKAMQLEKVRVYMSFFPELINKKELAAQTAEKMGDDPTTVLNEDVFVIAPPASENPAAQSMKDNGVGTLPQGNIANNAVRGIQGGEQTSNDFRDLQNSMLG